MIVFGVTVTILSGLISNKFFKKIIEVIKSEIGEIFLLIGISYKSTLLE